tara:strand:+ start:501 stop:683 length:183 start_codon:yes stop_codon:yes gene_type:complete
MRKIAELGTSGLPILLSGPTIEMASVGDEGIGRTLAKVVRNPAAVLPFVAAGICVDVAGI